MASFNQNVVFNGLGTFSLKVPFTTDYFIEGKISLPTLTAGGGASQLLVVVNQNGSPVYTGQVGADGFKANLNCAENDLIAVVFSSSAPADQGKNVIKSNISIGLGQ